MISDATGALFLLLLRAKTLAILLGLKERILVADTSARVCQTLRNNKAVAAKAADGIARRRR